MIIVLTCVQFEVFNESNYSRALHSSDFGHKIKTKYFHKTVQGRSKVQKSGGAIGYLNRQICIYRVLN